MSRDRSFSRLLCSASVAVLLSACAVTPVTLTDDDMKTQAELDRKEMFASEAPVTRPLTLSDAIARALTQNLDRRTKVMEEAMASGQRYVDRWDLLPKLVANAGYTGRSESNATQSRDAVTGITSSSNPTYSTDRDSITTELGLTWNILDFGVSYVNAHQNANKALVASERRRKTVHNLIQEVRFAFWRTAAAQTLRDEVSTTVSLAEQALADSRAVENEGLRSPAEMLRYQKNLLESLRQLESISQELSTARYELAALINLPPGSEMVVEVPTDSQMAIPTFDMTPQQMEESAFINNPDLREQVYMTRITVDETKKTILKMLPGINLSLGDKWDSNSFLVANHWYEAGAKISWNLFNLLSAPDQLNNAELAEKVANAKRVALRMAILAQVHVSYSQFLNASRQFQRASDLHGVEQRLAKFVELRTANDAQSVLEKISNQTSAIAARLRRYQTYAQMQSAFGKMQATLGQDLLPDQVSSHHIDDLSKLIAARLDTWGQPVQKEAGPMPMVDAPVPEAAPVPVAAMPEAGKETVSAAVVLPSEAISEPAVRRKPRPAALKTVKNTAPSEMTPPAAANATPSAPVVQWIRPGLSDEKWADLMERAAELRAKGGSDTPAKYEAVLQEVPPVSAPASASVPAAAAAMTPAGAGGGPELRFTIPERSEGKASPFLAYSAN